MAQTIIRLMVCSDDKHLIIDKPSRRSKGYFYGVDHEKGLGTRPFAMACGTVEIMGQLHDGVVDGVCSCYRLRVRHH